MLTGPVPAIYDVTRRVSRALIVARKWARKRENLVTVTWLMQCRHMAGDSDGDSGGRDGWSAGRTTGLRYRNRVAWASQTQLASSSVRSSCRQSIRRSAVISRRGALRCCRAILPQQRPGIATMSLQHGGRRWTCLTGNNIDISTDVDIYTPAVVISTASSKWSHVKLGIYYKFPLYTVTL